MSMRSKQSGVTLIGWIILLIPMAICFYAGIRIGPVYLNYWRVAKVFEQVKSEFKDSDPGNAASIRVSLEKKLDIDYVEYPAVKDIKISRAGRGWVVSVAYDDQAPLFANVFILMTFEKSVTLGSGASD
jgi:hypothetical protein